MNILQQEILQNFQTRPDLAARGIKDLVGEVGGIIESDGISRYLMLIMVNSTMTGFSGLESIVSITVDDEPVDASLNIEVIHSEEQGLAVGMFASEELLTLLVEKGFIAGWYRMGTTEVVSIDVDNAQQEAKSKAWDAKSIMVRFPKGEPYQVFRGEETWPVPDNKTIFIILERKRRRIWPMVSFVLLGLFGCIVGFLMPRSVNATIVAVAVGLCILTKSRVLRVSIILLAIVIAFMVN